MAKNILFVEGNDDVHTLSAILEHMAITANVKAVDFHSMGGLDPDKEKPTKIVNALKGKLSFLENGSKVGIILDLDTESQIDRLSMINNALKIAYTSAFTAKSLQQPNTFIDVVFDEGKINERKVQFACHFINVGGRGEMENLLRKIKKQNAPFADCLEEGWQVCFEKKGKILSDTDPNKNITPKEMIKLWLGFYQKFDILSSKTKRKDYEKWEDFMAKFAEDAFDFSNTTVPEFVELKKFLQMFA